MVTERTGLRRRAAELLKQGETPEAVKRYLRGMGASSRDARNIVGHTLHKLRIEDSDYHPPNVDTTGLVEWAAGHFADPRSAEIIEASRRMK